MPGKLLAGPGGQQKKAGKTLAGPGKRSCKAGETLAGPGGPSCKAGKPSAGPSGTPAGPGEVAKRLSWALRHFDAAGQASNDNRDLCSVASELEPDRQA
jgi:hypothetical protein